MDPLLKENLITTKDAGELSGYTSDYLSRLVRAGKIVGKRIGHNWVIDRESLEHFLKVQGNNKIDRARELASERAREYRTHRSLIRRTTRVLTTPFPVSKQVGIAGASFFSHAAALVVAFLVVASGVLMAQSAGIPQLANTTASFARETAFGFNTAFGEVPMNIITRIDTARDGINAPLPKVAAATARVSAHFASPLLAEPNLSILQMKLDEPETRYVTSRFARKLSPDAVAVTAADVQAFARDTFAFLSSPSHITTALITAYLNMGERSYAAINASFATYDSLIITLGDWFRTTPQSISHLNLALGEFVITAAHTAIRADVQLAYATADAAPKSARATFAFLGTLGNALEHTAARTPAIATTLFLRTTEAPAR
ncbi:MAG: helix-turn-helix domain-containing protein, partial [Minisyncoccia bacterium]